MDPSNACLPRWTAARIASADLVETNGLGLSLASAMKRLMAVCSSTIEEDAALEALPGEFGKPTFDRVGPRT